MMTTTGSDLASTAPDPGAARPRRGGLTGFRECRRTWRALSRGESGTGRGWSGTELTDAPPISKIRAVAQVALSAVLVPACLWALFGPRELGAPARETASALLGAIVAFWLKD
jgi:hypothetical protein